MQVPPVSSSLAGGLCMSAIRRNAELPVLTEQPLTSGVQQDHLAGVRVTPRVEHRDAGQPVGDAEDLADLVPARGPAIGRDAIGMAEPGRDLLGGDLTSGDLRLDRSV